MDASSRSLSDVIGLLKSWIPWRSDPVHESRDFWMPDESCTVCYECDSQFGWVNRKHHCRLCGRIFCGKCASNLIPPPPSERKTALGEQDKIRVCNYCFKQWKQVSEAPVDYGNQVANMDLSSSSPSATSFLSTKSSVSCDSSSVTVASLPQCAGLSPHQSAIMETTVKRQSPSTTTTSDHSMGIGGQNPSLDHFACFTNRNDEDDEEFGVSRLGSRRNHFSQVNGYYGHVPFDDIDSDYKSRKVHPDGDAIETKSISSSSMQNSLDSQASEEIQEIVGKGIEHDIVEDCEATPLYAAEDVNAEPVDFDNNWVLWLPPEPENEEDEREALLLEDDDDGDAAGEWGYMRESGSFGSGVPRGRDKSNEEHKRAVKNVVDGHFRALVAQLLQVANLPAGEDNDKESWLEIITALSWEAATLLKPDMSKGGQMDPGGYVKVKCLASGHRHECMVVKGVVCKKNVAHRRMTTKIEKPRLMILGGALEYQRISNALSSFDTLLQQEMDHLKMAVARIDAHNPDILLVEKSVSRYAQEYLLAKDISLVLNIKKPLLERIARCTGSQIVPSIDHLSSQKLGYCDMFHVERFLEEHGTASRNGKKLVKTLMYFEGCPKPLGCTILLRGANGDELKKVKHVVQYGVFAAYHLALETSFLADEGASLPELPLNSPITVALPDKPSPIDRSISTIPGFTVPENDRTPGPQSVSEPPRSNSVPSSDLIKATLASDHGSQYTDASDVPDPTSFQFSNRLVSSPVKGLQSYSLDEPMQSHGSEERVFVDLAVSSEATHLVTKQLAAAGESITKMHGDWCDAEANKNVADPSSLQLDGNQNLEEQPALKEEFPPSSSDHQSILVSLSSRCVRKGTVCERSHLFRIKYYGNFDKPLGRFLRDHLFDQNYRCRSCELDAEAHVQCYTHRQGTLTISVKKMPDTLPGEKDGKIWMWHRCLRCPRTNGYPPATRRVVMSDAAWGLSLGKFLELSFSNHAAASRVASCGHSLHRDCLRFYGFGKMVACFRYASIDVHSVYLPPPKLDFNNGCLQWLKKEFDEVAGRGELLFSEALNTLSRYLTDNRVRPPESRRRIADLEDRLLKEKAEFEELLQKLWKEDVKNGQPAIDILELNRVRRQIVSRSYVWDQNLKNADAMSQSDGTEVTRSELIQIPDAFSEKLPDKNALDKRIHTLGSSDEDPRSDSGENDKQNNLVEIVLQRTDMLSNPDLGEQNPIGLSGQNKVTDEPSPLDSDVIVHASLPDEQAHISLSHIDAAWTGENHPGMGISKNNKAFETIDADTSSIVGMFQKLDVEDHGDDLSMSKLSQAPSMLSIRGSDIVEDGGSWFSSTFKKFLGTDEKLEAYSPAYSSEKLEIHYPALFRESEIQGGIKLFFAEKEDRPVVPVYDDEPTSIIAHALISPDYMAQLSDEPERPKDISESMFYTQSLDSGSLQSFHSLDEMVLESYRSFGSGDESILSLTSSRSSLPLDPVSYTKALHARVSFADDGPPGKAKYSVTCYYAKRFEALRQICCPSEMDFVRSLSRCKKWGAQGGKSNVFFAKTLDDRFIIKQVTKTELESFIKFAPGYFKYLSESIGSGSPTCLAKILGIYQVTSKHLKGGKETKMDVLVMENLLFGRNLARLYDLKGSSRSRYNPDCSGSNKVLLDQNLIEAMPTSPIFVGNKAKRLLERAVWNDTAFLASIDVMDYSLLVGVDEEKHELVLGIIDFMRQYTWDKHLETWVKASGILGGPKNAQPTVISPKQYKRRFRKAMTTYFLMVPDQWSPPTIIPSKSQTDLSEENIQNTASAE